MEKLVSYEEYKSLVSDFRTNCRKAFSNNYFMPNSIKRYIELERAYYERTDRGLFFYFDEETYYRVCIYVDASIPFSLEKKDKKLYFRVTYKEGREEKELPKIREYLGEIGFSQVSKTVQVKGDVEKLVERCGGIERYRDAMERKGFSIVRATPDQYKEIEEFILSSQIIKDYHMEYMTESEKAALPNGAYIYITDGNGNICGASICRVDGEISHGVGVAVKDQYKLLGFAPILADYRFKWLKGLGVKYAVGWIVTTNSTSIRYHKSLQYEFTDKYAEEWVME